MWLQDILPILILLTTFILLVFFWFVSKSFRKYSEKLGPLLNLLAIIAVLGVFIQLYYTVDQFNKANEMAMKEKAKQLISRMDALEAELNVNMGVCNWIINNSKNLLEGKSVINNTFYYPMIEEVMRSGEITDQQLLNPIHIAYHHMRLADNTMNRTMNLEYMKVVIDQDDETRKRSHKFLKGQMQHLIDHTLTIINNLRPALEQLRTFRKRYIQLHEIDWQEEGSE